MVKQRCPICGKESASKDSLRKHVKGQHPRQTGKGPIDHLRLYSEGKTPREILNDHLDDNKDMYDDEEWKDLKRKAEEGESEPKIPRFNDWACNMCSARFDNEREHDLHVAEEHPTCLECRKQFRNRKAYDEHTHPECHVCKKTFPTEKRLDNHLKSHPKCYQCDRQFLNEAKLRVHRMTRHGQRRGPAKPKERSRSRSPRLRLSSEDNESGGMASENESEISGDVSMPRPTDPRAESYELSDETAESMKTVDPEDEEDQHPDMDEDDRFSVKTDDSEDRLPPSQLRKCPKCYLKFTSQALLTKHLKTHTGRKPKYKRHYVCHYCGKHLPSQESLDAHVEVKHPTREHVKSRRPKREHVNPDPDEDQSLDDDLTLEDSDRTIGSSADGSSDETAESSKTLGPKDEDPDQDLDENESDISGDVSRPFSPTDPRAESYELSDEVAESVKTVDTEEEEEEAPGHKRHYVCDYCGKHLHSQESLDRHVAAKHHKRPTVRVYECGICKDILKTKEGYEQHIKNHQRYDCRMCAARFDSNTDRAMHMSLTHPRCTLCDQPFATIDEYVRHRQREHPEPPLDLSIESETEDEEGSDEDEFDVKDRLFHKHINCVTVERFLEIRELINQNAFDTLFNDDELLEGLQIIFKGVIKGYIPICTAQRMVLSPSMKKLLFNFVANPSGALLNRNKKTLKQVFQILWESVNTVINSFMKYV